MDRCREAKMCSAVLLMPHSENAASGSLVLSAGTGSAYISNADLHMQAALQLCGSTTTSCCANVNLLFVGAGRQGLFLIKAGRAQVAPWRRTLASLVERKMKV